MKTLLKINDPVKMSEIVDELHDCWFDADNILFDKQESTLNIRYVREDPNTVKTIWKLLFIKKLRFAFEECFLKIHHVEKYIVDDKNKIGEYDFNTLEYNSDSQCISILTGIPIDIRIFVNKLEISIISSGKIVKEEEKISI